MKYQHNQKLIKMLAKLFALLILYVSNMDGYKQLHNVSFLTKFAQVLTQVHLSQLSFRCKLKQPPQQQN